MIKKRFKQYAVLCKEIKQLDHEINRLEYVLRKMDIALMLVHPISGEEVNRVQDKLLNLGEEYIIKMEHIYKERLELEKCISKLDEGMERIIMRYRYIDLFKWEIIMKKVGYEKSQVYRIHNRALDKLEKLCA